MSFVSRWQQKLTELGQLPEPSAEAWQLSELLVQSIRQQIQQGPLSFGQFMQQALYAPGLGYYSAGATKFGAAGDFITAPELSPLFGQTVARQIRPLLAQLPQAQIIEVGAGSGALAVALINELQQQQALPERYAILELSADLRQRQQQQLQQHCPEFYPRIEWLDSIPTEPVNAVVIANEVLDAMPVELWRWQQQQLQQAYLREQNQQFELDWLPASAELQHWFTQHIDADQLPESYQSEVCLWVGGWLQAWASAIHQGALLLIDYGFGQSEFYHPQRDSGTLMCHYRHRAHTDPLVLLGLQDITAHVNFSQVAHAAVDAGFELHLYSSQASFLLAGGLLDVLAEQTANNPYQASVAVKILTLPHEMGELFKVMLVSKNLNIDPPIACLQDWRHRL